MQMPDELSQHLDAIHEAHRRTKWHWVPTRRAMKQSWPMGLIILTLTVVMWGEIRAPMMWSIVIYLVGAWWMLTIVSEIALSWRDLFRKVATDYSDAVKAWGETAMMMEHYRAEASKAPPTNALLTGRRDFDA